MARAGTRTLVGAALGLFGVLEASAHCLVGGRLFPSTMAIDDPCVNDEMALPAFTAYGTGDQPADRAVEWSGHYAKRVADKVALMAGVGWTRLSRPRSAVSGFGALETGVKYQFLTLAEPELVVSAGLFVEWGGTGRRALEAPRFNVYTPSVFFGKGFGDLPTSLNALRPFATTGQLGYAIPAWSRTATAVVDPAAAAGFEIDRHPRVLLWGGSLQYSLNYLRQHVHDFDWPETVNRLIPIVEFAFETPVANTATSGRTTRGTINPGVVYAQKAYQIAVEASIPINRASGKGVGVRAQLHLILDEILPRSITNPVF